MIAKIKHDDQIYDLDMDAGVDLSINNDFSGNTPIFYGADQPRIEPECAGDFIGDVRQGGSCNVPIVSFNIHCTGTHTECIAHIIDSEERISDVCPKGLIPACIITVEPEKASSIDESYHCDILDDLVISKHAIRKKLSSTYDALIIRTLPNDRSKLSRNYDERPAPFFTNDAVDHINELGVKHLLVDVPSIDKANDGGRLGNHRTFFKHGDTISELLYIPDDILDGFGFLQIQIPNWSLDSAPSRPIFFPV
ncbi:MAG: cyclase family protein [Candidatus Marinimicrobia bacterium]|nr:cyclase family protein [Candidatus Neomarinimicrobiota bacterium]